jgi:uncharacterized protein YgbK (DUF1537 family)
MRILAIADDLSGAAEITGIGARYGLAARLERDAPAVAHPGLTVLDTDTRLLPQDEAAQRVQRAVRLLRGEDFDLIYKKTDSALRGPLLAEIDALMDFFGRRVGLLVAQNPSRGRTIQGGVYRIDGIPLDATSFAHDPEYPARTPNALELLGKAKQRATRSLAATEELPDDGVAIGDAKDGAEVWTWAQRASAGTQVLSAGGADFFAALLKARGLADSRQFLTALPPGRALFVCGTAPAFSESVVAKAQSLGIAVCPMPEHSRGAAVAIEEWQTAARTALESNGRAVLVIQRPLDRSPGAPQRFQAALAEAVGRLLDADIGVENLLLEGGATASAVCRRMHWNPFNVEGEFAPGVVQMRALRPDGTSEHRVVIKPGSYGWPDAVWAPPACAPAT